MPHPHHICGYVLAGGRSSRMGRDKALVSLGGKPLVEHAVAKLRRICGDIRILSSDPDLAAFAPIIPDIHPNCGPIGAIEAALAHASRDWNLFLPVDMPLVPAAFLSKWVADVVSSCRPGIRIFTAGDRPQPSLCLIHRAAGPLIARAIEREEFALISVFEEAGREGGLTFANQLLPNLSTPTDSATMELWQALSPAQLAAQPLWFLNINTKEDLALAQAQVAALDA